MSFKEGDKAWYITVGSDLVDGEERLITAHADLIEIRTYDDVEDIYFQVGSGFGLETENLFGSKSEVIEEIKKRLDEL
tara:strand:- start:232 stop:465 length:234 start_codon:yes stop_codon:yes gene_type:complete